MISSKFPNKMIEKRSALAFAALLLGSIFLAWQVFSVVVADRLAVTQPDTALRWEGGHVRALTRKAESLISGDDDADAQVAEAERLIQRAMKAGPLYSPAIRIAALVEEERGNPERAAGLMERAANRSLFESPAHLWLLNYYAQEGDLEKMVAHMNVLMTAPRVLPGEVRPRLMEALVALAGGAATSETVIAELSTNPSWRSNFLERFANEAANAESAVQFFVRLQESASPPSETELAFLLRRLMSEGNFEDAYLMWIASLQGTDGLVIANIFNGGFEQPLGATPFDWNIRRSNTADVSIAPRAENENALSIRIEGGREAFQNVSQALLLNAGEYELSGEYRAEAPSAIPALEWVVVCGDGEIAGRAGPFSRTLGWSTFTSLFTIPSNCPGQFLRLQHVPESDTTVSGEIWFDNIQAVRVGPGG